MNIRRIWRAVALFASLLLIFSLGMPTTLAYVAAKSNTLTNSFTLNYMPPEDTGVQVQLRKTVRCLGSERIGPDGFQFKLENTLTHEVFLLVTDEKGYASFAVPFTHADLGKEHSFTLSEINDGRKYVSYSDVVYDITIVPDVDADNNIIAGISVNGKPVEKIAVKFENTYTGGIPVPDTGDHMNFALCAAMVIIGVGGMIFLAAPRRCRSKK